MIHMAKLISADGKISPPDFLSYTHKQMGFVLISMSQKNIWRAFPKQILLCHQPLKLVLSWKSLVKLKLFNHISEKTRTLPATGWCSSTVRFRGQCHRDMNCQVCCHQCYALCNVLDDFLSMLPCNQHVFLYIFSSIASFGRNMNGYFPDQMTFSFK